MEQDTSSNNPAQAKTRFMPGFLFGLATYPVAAFLLFWIAVLRRASVLNVPVVFDSDVAAAIDIVPIMVAIAWLPFSIMNGFLTKKMAFRKALRTMLPAAAVLCFVLGIVFWRLPYN